MEIEATCQFKKGLMGRELVPVILSLAAAKITLIQFGNLSDQLLKCDNISPSGVDAAKCYVTGLLRQHSSND